MKIKTSELVGAALDWAVLEAAGAYKEYVSWREATGDPVLPKPIWFKRLSGHPSTDWSQAGPIIEREWLDLTVWPNESDENMRWMADQYDAACLCRQYGPTPLIAAMRCYVESKLGDEVDVPDKLVCENTVHS